VAWKAAGEFAKESVEAVDSAALGQEHVGAFTGNNTDAVLTAEFDGFRTDSTLTTATVHPDAVDSSFGAILNDRVGDLRGSHEQGGVDSRLDVLNACEAFAAEDSRQRGIHGNNVVTAVGELLKEKDAEIARVAGDPDDREAFLGEKIVNGVESGVGSWHDKLLRGMADAI